jgi:predicted Zn-dependent protease
MKTIKKIIFSVILALLFISCTKAPITGRSQFIMVDPAQEMQLAIQTKEEILKTKKLSQDATKNSMVKRVGMKIANITGQNSYNWEFFVIDNPKEENAFCLPGGKVFVYSGLFKYIANDAELAAVLGHEIGHALARHGAERMSSGMLAQTGGQVLQTVIAGRGSPETRAVVMEAFGAGTELGIMLPHSRTQEYEADRIGLVLMAKAGYNPQSALTFWEKFSKSGETPPEYLSSHPAPANRISTIKKLLPQIMPIYEKAKG